MVMEVETEKAVAPVEIPFAGTITEILRRDGRHRRRSARRC